MNDPNPRRILLAKTSLDGHWRGLSVVARALRDGGFHVIMGGMLTGQEIVRAAVDEDVDLVGLNVGGHVEVVVRVIGELGVETYPPGSSLEDIVTAARRLTGQTLG